MNPEPLRCCYTRYVGEHKPLYCCFRPATNEGYCDEHYQMSLLPRLDLSKLLAFELAEWDAPLH